MLNRFLKHGIIVGIVTILLSLMLMIVEIPFVHYIFTTEDGLTDIYKTKHISAVVLAFASIIVSAIMIWGIVKKSRMLLIPWMVLSFVIIVIIAFTEIYENLTLGYHPDLSDFIVCIFIIGFGIILIYPIYILYVGMPIQNSDSEFFE